MDTYVGIVSSLLNLVATDTQDNLESHPSSDQKLECEPSRACFRLGHAGEFHDGVAAFDRTGIFPVYAASGRLG